MAPKAKRKAQSPADFPKKKQKVGKSKVSPSNTTKVAFKTGQIVVPVQLSETTGSSVTSARKQTVQALLLQLRHHNVKKRSEALDNLKEIFVNHTEVVLQHLQALIEHSVPLYTDPEPRVRHSFLLMMKRLLPLVPGDVLPAYRNHILASLQCGLTHLTESIRMDTVKVIDLFYIHHPSIFGEKSLSFLQMLSSLLSKEPSKGARGSKSASPKTPHLSARNGRLEILSIILKFLHCIIQSRPAREFPSQSGSATLQFSEDTVQLISTGGTEDCGASVVEVSREFYCLSVEGSHLAFHNQFGLFPTEEAIMERHQAAGLAMEKAAATDKLTSSGPHHKDLKQMYSTLFPLLIECWIESVPDALKVCSTADTEVQLNEMMKILQIVNALLQLAACTLSSEAGGRNGSAENLQFPTEIAKAYGAGLTRHLLVHFPYSKSFSNLASQKHYIAATLITFDILLCEIFVFQSLFCQSSILNSISSFLSEGMSNIPSTPSLVPVTTSFLVRVLNLIGQLNSSLRKNGWFISLMKTLIKVVWTFYQKIPSGGPSRKSLDKCFRRLLEAETASFGGQMNTGSVMLGHLLVPWLVSLPEQLVVLATQNDIQECATLVEVMIMMAPLGIIEFGESLQTNLIPILTTFSEVSLSNWFQSRLIELVLYMPMLGAPELRALMGFLQSGALNRSAISYLLELIGQRMLGRAEGVSDLSVISSEGVQIPVYLQFMFTLSVGYTQLFLESIQSHPDSEDFATKLTGIAVLPSQHQDKSTEVLSIITSCVFSALKRVTFSSQLWELSSFFFSNILTSNTHVCLPVDAAKGLLQLALCFTRESNIPDEVKSYIVQLILTVKIRSVNTCKDNLATVNSLKDCSALSCDLMGQSLALMVAVLEAFKTLLWDLKSGSSNLECRAVVQALVSVLKEPILEDSLQQCKVVVAGVKYTARISLGGTTEIEDGLLLESLEAATTLNQQENNILPFSTPCVSKIATRLT